MANVEIIELTALTNPASSDVLPIVDVGADETKKVTIADLLENAGSGTASAAAFAFDGDADTGMYRTGANALGFTTGGTGRLFIDSSGNVGIGDASPAVACDVVGQVRASTGILFGSDTAAANALDDYEEGDWTPVFQGTTTPGTPVYGANGQAGKYIKVGKMVQIMAYLVITDIGGAAGNVQITGLPYNPDLTFFGSGIGTGHADGTLGNSVRLTNNSSSLLLRNNNSSVGVTTGSIYINCTYRTF